jgi:hypothetical protein
MIKSNQKIEDSAIKQVNLLRKMEEEENRIKLKFCLLSSCLEFFIGDWDEQTSEKSPVSN